MSCNSCYKDIESGFCSSCKRKLFDRSDVPVQLDFNWSDLKEFKQANPKTFSMSGMQSKGYISRLRNKLVIPTDKSYLYMIKPAISKSGTTFSEESPVNEHLTMTMAENIFKINTALSALLRFKDGKWAYVTKLFDRDNKGNRLLLEDFASILNAIPKTENDDSYKYEASTYFSIGEKLSFIDKLKFIKILIYNFAIGNCDAHLKNFSLIESSDKDMIYSPAYDLMNTRLHIYQDKYPALNFGPGFERGFDISESKHKYDYMSFVILGEKLGLDEENIYEILKEFKNKKDEVLQFVTQSFLTEKAKIHYNRIVMEQYKQLNLKEI